MAHVDALSRQTHGHVGMIMDDGIEFQLSLAQARDKIIEALRIKLEIEPSELYALENGLVYRKVEEERLLFYVPTEMENNIIRTVHEKMGHLGINKCFESIRMNYWFPSMKNKIQHFIENCVRCVMHSVPRIDRTLHSIPKAPVPFDTIHLDHYGPLTHTMSKKKYILGICDGFTKHTRLAGVNTTSTRDVIEVLKKYFRDYSRPRRIIVDRASCFDNKEFKEFLNDNNIQLINVATAAPHANGQIERVNRVLTPMLGKLSNMKNQSDWSKVLEDVEYALNNTISATTKQTASMLLFGVLQRGKIVDELSEYLQEKNEQNEINLVDIRAKAEKEIKCSQRRNEEYHAKRFLPAKEYKLGDFVVIKNVDTTIGTNKKLIPKYRGPYRIHKVLPNDRYVIKDIENCQQTQIPYTGILEASRIKKWISDE